MCHFYNFTTNKIISPLEENVEYAAAPLAFLSRLFRDFEFRDNDATQFKCQKAPLRLVHSRSCRYRLGIAMVTFTNAFM